VSGLRLLSASYSGVVFRRLATWLCLQTFPFLQKDIKKSRNREIAELFDSGGRTAGASRCRGDSVVSDCLLHVSSKRHRPSVPADPARCGPAGLGIHHAGMLRSDRNLMERAFAQGLIKVLAAACTCALPSQLLAALPACKSRPLLFQAAAHPSPLRRARRCCAVRPPWPGASTCQPTLSSSRARSCTTPRREALPTWVSLVDDSGKP
jgi:hypothetical protein